MRSAFLGVLLVCCYLPTAAVLLVIWPDMTPNQFGIRTLVYGSLVAVVAGLAVLRWLGRH